MTRRFLIIEEESNTLNHIKTCFIRRYPQNNAKFGWRIKKFHPFTSQVASKNQTIEILDNEKCIAFPKRPKSIIFASIKCHIQTMIIKKKLEDSFWGKNVYESALRYSFYCDIYWCENKWLVLTFFVQQINLFWRTDVLIA